MLESKSMHRVQIFNDTLSFNPENLSFMHDRDIILLNSILSCITNMNLQKVTMSEVNASLPEDRAEDISESEVTIGALSSLRNNLADSSKQIEEVLGKINNFIDVYYSTL